MRRIYHVLPLLLLVAACGGQKKNEVKENASWESAVTPQPVASESAVGEADDTAGIKMLKEFYSASLSESVHQGLDARYLTRAMQQKVRRMSQDAGANMVIRAQDVPADSCETLKIEPLGNSWYRVSYTSGRGTAYEESISIPVKVMKEDGEHRVGYITPATLGQQYGDSLWYSGTEFPTVDRSEPFAFVKSFYDLYTLKHSTLSDRLLQELAAIRTDYLTPKALSCFNRMEQLNRDDGYLEYDALIGRHDFEYPWRSSVRVNPTEQADVFQAVVLEDTIRISVVEQGGEWFVDGIE